jgi:lipid-A-disaccharide synthase
MKSNSPTICLVAADVSADQNAGRLVSAIRKLAPHVRLVGAGGEEMLTAGLEAFIESSEVSMVGPPGSLRELRAMLSVWRRLTTLIEEAHPDVAVLIDNETLATLLARWLKQRGIPTVFFFPPQIWFWGRWRLKWIAPITRLALCAFRQEAELYRAAGVETVWTGHPLCDVVAVHENPVHAARSIGIDPTRPFVMLMPGSRFQELKWNCQLMFDTAKRLLKKDARLQFALPLAREDLRRQVEFEAQRAGLRDLVTYTPQSFAVMSQARAVLQCSGTATLETALLGIPSVILYRCNPWRYYVARRFMYVRYIGMVNILLNEMVQPEFFHWRIEPQRVANELWSILTDEKRRTEIAARLGTLRDIIGPSGGLEKAARAILSLVPGSAGLEMNGTEPNQIVTSRRQSWIAR